MPFFFKSGNPASKNKFFIVLKNIDNKIIIASLPTSSSKAPALIAILHGCINHDDRCFNCYLFEEGRVISDNGFCFELNTYIYGNEVEDYLLEDLNRVYAIEGIDYEIVGKLTELEYNDLYQCISNSSSVKRKIKRLFDH
jgi:hypothetical protein